MGLPFEKPEISATPSLQIPLQSISSPTTLSLILRSLPPDKFRENLECIISSFSIKAISHCLIGSIDINEIDESTILSPRRSANFLPPTSIWNNEQIERALADGKYTLERNEAGERKWLPVTSRSPSTLAQDMFSMFFSRINRIEDRNRDRRINQRLITLRNETDERNVTSTAGNQNLGESEEDGLLL